MFQTVLDHGEMLTLYNTKIICSDFRIETSLKTPPANQQIPSNCLRISVMKVRNLCNVHSQADDQWEVHFVNFNTKKKNKLAKIGGAGNWNYVIIPSPDE